MKRHTLPIIALAVSAFGCRPTNVSLEGSVIISPTSKGVADSFFPDGPTAGYRLRDTAEYASMELVARDSQTRPEEGMSFDFLRAQSPTAQNSGHSRFELLGKGSEILQTFLTDVNTSTAGGKYISVSVEGNPEASGYQIVSSTSRTVWLHRQFPTFSDAASVLQLRQLKDGHYLLVLPGRSMAIGTFFSLDEGHTWSRVPISLFVPFTKAELGTSGDRPVLLDVRVAQPGRYTGARYQLP